MTNSSDPKAPRSSRKKPPREPATIDLKATVIDEGNKREGAQDNGQGNEQNNERDNAWQNVRPEETIVPEPEAVAEDNAASPEATLDSGMGTDSIAPELSEQQAAPETEVPPTPPAAAPERRSSPAMLIGSGLLGGLIGAGIVYALQVSQTPVPAAQDSQRLAQLEQRVSALGQQPQGQGQGNLQALQQRLQALESARGSLDQRLQEIQTTAERAAARAEEAANRSAPEAPQNNEVVDQLAARLSALEGQVQEGARSATEAASAAQALERRVSEEGSRLAQQDQRLATLSQQVTEANKGAEAASQTGVQLVLAERLSDALRSGTPYADTLEGLRKTGVSAEKLSALEPFAQKGAPTAVALAQSFEPLEAQILRDQRAASGEWSDRLLRMVDKVVTVRPVDGADSTGVPSTLARIRQTLGWGDMGGAAAAWASLPEPARRLSEDWGRQVTAAAGAQQASQEIASEALATLNRSTQ